MSEFEGQIIEFLDGETLCFGCVTERDSKKLRLLTERGRAASLPPARVLWNHPGRVPQASAWPAALEGLQARIAGLQEEIDTRLLWETVREVAEPWDLADLAELYFSQATPAHQSALWRELAADKLHFRRRGAQWEPRTAAQVEEQLAQQQRAQERAAVAAQAQAWLRKALRSEEPVEAPPEMEALLTRLELFLRRREDEDLRQLLESLTAEFRPPEAAFEILIKAGRLAADADPYLVLAGLEPDFPAPVEAAAHSLTPFAVVSGEEVVGAGLGPALFSIDDEDTREVDDALALTREGDLWRVGIYIADAAHFVTRGDPLDAEAFRRSSTVYLPTQSVLMLPERLSCHLASLQAGEIRPTVAFEVWLDGEARIRASRIRRVAARVTRRLHYEEADAWIAAWEEEQPEQAGWGSVGAGLGPASGPGGDDEPDLVASLGLLARLAERLQAQRVARGALTQRWRTEWKVKVQDGEVTVKRIDPEAPSRRLVSELMILANGVAADFAQREGVPLIFRAQDPPDEPLPPLDGSDPLAIHHLRRLLKPARLSLYPLEHFGLGLGAYTQVTSPLRRFADLVMQRQLVAHLAGEALPYDQEELLTVLATAESVEQEVRRVESHANRHWLLEYLARNLAGEPLEVLVVEETHGGHRVELTEWGLSAFLARDPCQPGQRLWARIDQIVPRRGYLRLRAAK